MARSRKDGRRAGSHRGHGHPGREYWSARPHSNMADWGTGKREVHQAERRANKRACAEEPDEEGK